MPSSVSSRSLCLLRTSLTLAALASLGACSDPANCGVGAGAVDHFIVSDGTHTLTFTELTSLAANDCPDPTAPGAPTSVTIEGHQVDGPGLVTLCIPRPDLLGSGVRRLGTRASGGGDILIEDLNGEAGGCALRIDSSVAPAATAQASGVCNNATNAAGFEMVATGTLAGKRTCGTAMEESATLTLDADVAVTLRPH